MIERQFDIEHPYTLVVGLGDTGLSVVRYLSLLGETAVIADSRDIPPGMESLKHEFPDYQTSFGQFESELFLGAKRIILSPGVAPQNSVIQEAANNGVEILGDIELFARNVTAPVIVITGSNGKSTVTTLLGEMARCDHKQVGVGGNIGTPALDLLLQGNAELYILELSSFQLEVTQSLAPIAAVVLNVSDDHLNRHQTIDNYASIKQRIYSNAETKVVNQDDAMVGVMVDGHDGVIRYGLKPHDNNDLYLQYLQGREAIYYQGQVIIYCDEIKMPGRHNISNAMAAIALAVTAGISKDAIVYALKTFSGLPHRCQWITEKEGVAWYDDSKGTNVGAAISAIEGLPQQKVILIAGGQGKGADFTPLGKSIIARCRAVILIGEDAERINDTIKGKVPVFYASSMDEAVSLAKQNAKSGDAVLLSPACASFDMFTGYVDRGLKFQQSVREIVG